MNQKSDLDHCLFSKCQISAIFVFLDINTDGLYVALNTSNEQYLTVNDHPNYLRKNNLEISTMNDKLSKNTELAP